MSEQVASAPAPNASQDPSSVPAPPSGEAAGQSAPPTEPARGSGGKKKLIGIVGALVVFAVITGLKFGLASLFDSDKTAEAKSGDCIAELPETIGEQETEVSGAKVVACTDTDAAYNVVGRVDDQTEAQARTGEACEPYFKEGEDGYVFYSVKPGATGYLLCLTRKA
ncbi:hypothetical protein ACIBO1_01640 [Micromonospora sp. NPDC049903]|uniref:LppU/SCO3897 family protein n=1 Tax=Micromonospora sp. NPDC049903 TaxID=3364276 RepID=UPI0037A94676